MTTYTVQPGDTLGQIAKQFYGDPDQYKVIAEANHLANPNLLEIGATLVIPKLAEPPPPEAVPPGSQVVLTTEQLQQIMPRASSDNIEKYRVPLNQQMPKFQINTPMRVAQFLAQLAVESGSFYYNQENLNYSVQGLLAVFGDYFPNEASAREYARQPEKIANRVYANRMGNGSEASGDGWKYRGRGLIQLTGLDNYRQCSEGIGIKLEEAPEHMANDPEIVVDGAGWYWQSRNLNQWADEDNIKEITLRINGGYNGLKQRMAFLRQAKKVLHVK